MANISDAPHVIDVDDVQPAELVARVATAHNSIINHLAREHVDSGPGAGLHALPVVPSAVARWNPPGDVGSSDRTLDAVVSGSGRCIFASPGFAETPRLVVGVDPMFSEAGYYLRWKLSKPVGQQHVACTVGWSSSGSIEKLVCGTDDEGNGVLRLATEEFVSTDPVLPDLLKYMTHITIAIHETP